jgi:hypothetical protein
MYACMYAFVLACMYMQIYEAAHKNVKLVIKKNLTNERDNCDQVFFHLLLKEGYSDRLNGAPVSWVSECMHAYVLLHECRFMGRHVCLDLPGCLHACKHASHACLFMFVVFVYARRLLRLCKYRTQSFVASFDTMTFSLLCSSRWAGTLREQHFSHMAT